MVQSHTKACLLSNYLNTTRPTYTHMLIFVPSQLTASPIKKTTKDRTKTLHFHAGNVSGNKRSQFYELINTNNITLTIEDDSGTPPNLKERLH